MIQALICFTQDLVNEKIRTQQLTDEVERINREIEAKMMKSTEVRVTQTEQ